MLENLEKGLNADGAVMLEDKAEERRAVGIEMWRQRERQVLYSLVNCCVLHQDFESAVKCLDMVREVETRENMASLHAAYGRYCTLLYCTVLYFTILYCTILQGLPTARQPRPRGLCLLRGLRGQGQG